MFGKGYREVRETEGSRNGDSTVFLHKTVLETICTLDNMFDPSQIDGVVLRLDCIKRYLVNISDDLQTDVIVSQLQQVIDSLQEERNQYENRVSSNGR